MVYVIRCTEIANQQSRWPQYEIINATRLTKLGIHLYGQQQKETGYCSRHALNIVNKSYNSRQINQLSIKFQIDYLFHLLFLIQ